MCTLYERIIELCKSKGVTGSRMCIDLGLSKSTLSDIKSGRKRGISTNTAQKMAAYFGVTVDYLLGEETKKAPIFTEKDERSGIVKKLNVLRIAGRDGSYEERLLTDEQLAALKAIIDQLPDASDDL